MKDLLLSIFPLASGSSYARLMMSELVATETSCFAPRIMDRNELRSALAKTSLQDRTDEILHGLDQGSVFQLEIVSADAAVFASGMSDWTH